MFLEAGRASLAAATPVEPDTDPGGPNLTPPPTDSLATARPTVRADAAIPYIGRFELRYFDDIESLIDAWAEGELDAVSGFQPADVAALQAAFRGVSLAAPGAVLAANLDLRPGRRELGQGPQGAPSGNRPGRDRARRAGWAGFPVDLLIPPSSPVFDSSKSPVVASMPPRRASSRLPAGRRGRELDEKDAKDPIVIELLSPEERQTRSPTPPRSTSSRPGTRSGWPSGTCRCPPRSCSTPPGRG